LPRSGKAKQAALRFIDAEHAFDRLAAEKLGIDALKPVNLTAA
jgi:hypothetical protein